MRILILLHFLVISINGFSQFDSLRKYSYPVFGFTAPKYKFFGSCFFIRNKGDIFLITAEHVITGYDGHGNYAPHFPDSLLINVNDNHIFFIHTKKLRDSINSLINRKDTGDFIVIKINRKIGDYINSVESFIQPMFKEVNSIKVLGYPGYSFISNGRIIFPECSVMNLPDSGYIFQMKQDSITKKWDSNQAAIHINHFMKDYDSLGGFSGSPMFVQDKQSKKWRVLGVFTSSSSDPDNMCSIHYPLIECIIRRINEF